MFCTNCGQEINGNAVFCVKCGVTCGTEKKFCATCGKPVNENQAICLGCGCPLPQKGGNAPATQSGAPGAVGPAPQVPGKSTKDWTTTLLLCIFTGGIGGHRFYAGKIGTGVLFVVLAVLGLPTFGLTLIATGIWSLIDLIQIITKKFTDKDGYVIQ